MRKLVSLAALMGALLLVYAGGVLAQPQTPQQQQKIPNNYIVVFKEGVHDPTAVANEHARENGLRLRFVYQHALEGYAAVFPNDHALQRVQNDPKVDYVEQDQVARAVDQVLPWGIKRVGADVSSTHAGDGGLLYSEKNTISNVNAYIIDTGVDASHTDLNVVNHVNFKGDDKNYDCNGHGTHVAGTVAAKDNDQDVVGVAPSAPLTGVKVLGCGGTGAYSVIIAGVDWVTNDANVKGPDGTLGTSDDKPAVANMSLGGPRDTALNQAVRNSADSGVFYSIAAGNDGAKACAYSPASAGRTMVDSKWIYDNGIMTVAATNSSEGEPDWSNYGDCVDIWAPGVNVRSTKLGGGTALMSGTSMAAPHVGGGGVLYLSNPPTDPNDTGKLLNQPVDVEVALKDVAVNPGTYSKDDREITRLYVGGF